jgi:hypothetical protein
MITLEKRLREGKEQLRLSYKASLEGRKEKKELVKSIDKQLDEIVYIKEVIYDQFKVGYHDNRILENIQGLLNNNKIDTSHAIEYLQFLNNKY